MVRFDDFIQAFTQLIEQPDCDEPRLFSQGKQLLSELVSQDDWLPAEFTRASAQRYQQYLLHCDPQQRFSVVSFVWGPGQASPIHDHTVWGMIGVLRGAEICEEFERDPASGRLSASGRHRLLPGDIDLVSPRVGDIHRVSNALSDRPTVSIHIYGADIGSLERHVYAADTGAIQPFVSGYSNPGDS